MQLFPMAVVFVVFVWVSSALSVSSSGVSQHSRPTVHILRNKRRHESREVSVKNVHFHLGFLRRSLLWIALVLAQLGIHGVLSTFRRRQRVLCTPTHENWCVKLMSHRRWKWLILVSWTKSVNHVTLLVTWYDSSFMNILQANNGRSWRWQVRYFSASTEL